MKILIKGGTIVNEGKTFQGSVAASDGIISDIFTQPTAPRGSYDAVVDATGCFVLPGVIDTHVHFREPGMTHKADIDSESRAAVAGGVTTIFDMPNTQPMTVTPEALRDKLALGSKSHANYSFFYGATNTNAATFSLLDRHRVPGIKLFMGSSTGNLLVDRGDSLDQVFSEAARLGLIVMAHCEDSSIINRNMEHAKELYGEDPSVEHHPEIRSAEACLASTQRAISLAQKHHTRLHVAHVSTASELSLFEKNNIVGGPYDQPYPDITAEAAVPHILFSDADYATLGSRIKCNPAVKSAADRAALQAALTDGTITTIATDHAPHLLSEKAGGAARAMSGMPMVQFSLVAMLSLVDSGTLPLHRVVELMSHSPAKLFSISRRGFLRVGYHADVVIVKPHSPWTLRQQDILSKCAWSPLEGRTFNWKVEKTIVNGQLAYDNGRVSDICHGQEVNFI